MKILAIDTSSNVATVAILEDDKLMGEYILNHKKTHSQKIMPMIDELMKSLELQISDIDVFAVANGPGSFTGLRIGVATMKAFAHVSNKPIVGVSTLEGLAYNVPYCDCVISPIMDARRLQVYNGVYKWNKGECEVLRQPRALSIDECIDDLISLNQRVIFLGDGVNVYKQYIKEKMGDSAIFALSNVNEERASSVGQCAYFKVKQGKTVGYLEVEPVYLRKSQAEREYEQKEKK